MKIIYKDGTVAECPKEEELHVPVSYTQLTLPKN